MLPADFQAVLWTLDTAAVTTVSWYPENRPVQETILVRNGKHWLASQGTITTKAVPTAVQDVLAALLLVQTDKVVTQEKLRWGDFGVDDKRGIRVEIYQDDKLWKDFVVSNFTKQDSLNNTVSFMRMMGGDAVYQVNAALSTIFQRPFHVFRNDHVLVLNDPFRITQLDYFLTPDSSIQVVQTGTLSTSAASIAIDSLAWNTYLQQLQQLAPADFADDFDDGHSEPYFYRKVVLPLPDAMLQLTCYQDTTRQPSFIIHSSQNPEAYFSSDSSGLFQQIFQPLELLLEGYISTPPSKLASDE